MAHQRSLPVRGSKDAPKFDGTAIGLRRYFEDVEELSISVSKTTDPEKIAIALRYVTADEEATWRTIHDPTLTWDQFKDKVITLYPGADLTGRYTRSDLQEITRRNVVKVWTTKDEAGQYHRDFTRVSSYLIDGGKISRNEANMDFMNGIHPELRNRVLARLQYTKPSQDNATPYSIEHVLEAAIWCITGINFYTMYESPPVAGSSYTPSPENAVVTPKSEPVDFVSVMEAMNDKFQTSISTLAQTLVSALAEKPSYNNGPRRNWNRPENNGNRQGGYPSVRPQYPSNFGACNFCGASGHFIRECPRADEYISQGKCSRESSGRIIMPNGWGVSPLLPGRNIMERIDSWHRENKPPPPKDGPPHMATSLWYTSAYTYNAEPSYIYPDETTSTIEEVTDAGVYAQVAKTRSGAIAQTVEKKKVTKPAAPEKALPPPPKVVLPARTVPAPAPPRPLKPTGPNPPQDMQKEGPSFKYISQAENPELVKGVIERSLDTTVPITQRELLALSMDARRYFKDNTQTRRVPAVGVLAEADDEEEESQEEALILHYENSRERLEASHIDRLRTLRVRLNDAVSVDAILDQGSEIIAIDKCVWEDLGAVELLPDHTIIMESANSQKNHTLGLIENLLLEVGGIKLSLKAHVVKDAPFYLLLGRPFFRYTSCGTQDFTNGSQDLTLTCPTTARVVTVPTRAKPGGPPKPEEVVSTNFGVVGSTLR